MLSCSPCNHIGYNHKIRIPAAEVPETLEFRMKIVATIEARMASSRLPGKVLLPLAGAPALIRMVERVRRSERVDEAVVATTDEPGDDPIADLCAASGIACFRGSHEDVLARVLGAARWGRADLIVELTGDCPLIDPSHIDAMVRLYLEGGFEYVYNRLHAGYPDGLDVQVFSADALARIADLTQDPIDRAHVSSYFYREPGRFRVGGPSLDRLDDGYWPDLAITLDEESDYKLLAGIFANLYPDNPDFRTADVFRLLRANPDLLSLNRNVRRKELHEG
jgi:spore coat polysaccharide biosynthesis protein SpsF